MYRIFSRIVAASILVFSAIIGLASVSFAGMYDHVQMQSELATADNNGQGTWGNTSLARPVVTSLKINGDNVTLAENGDAANGNFGVTVAPVNVCRSDQTPGAGNCYSTPNRVSVSVYYNASGDAQADLSAHGLTSASVVELEIALNGAGPLLGWSYATGNPSHWEITNAGTTSATVKVALEPRDVPAINWGLHSGSGGCTRIPVQGCALDSSDAADTLQANLLLSLDTTLDEAFKGTLFAGDDTIIGSFETGPPGTPSLTYGVASAHNEFSGGQRTGTLAAVVSDSMLATYFGVDASTMSAAGLSAAFPIVRTTDTAGALTASVSWTRWSSGTEGTDGWLVQISGISFSAPKYKVSQGKTRPTGVAKLKSGKIQIAVQISGNARSACKIKNTKCLVQVAKLSAGKITQLDAKTLSTAGKATVVLSKSKVSSKGLKKGSKLAVQVWAQKSGKKSLISSSIFAVN